MRIILTSNFPRPGNDAVAAYLRDEAGMSHVAWISAASDPQRLESARAEFAGYGFRDLAPLPLTTEPLPGLAASTALYFSGGDPLAFRAVLAGSAIESWITNPRSGLRVLIGASGGAMQFTRNISLFRLTAHSLQDVLTQRANHRALGLVPFEILPHFDRQPAELVEAARRYSEHVDHAIWCLADGAALIATSDHAPATIGAVSCLRGGRFS
jgi:peptidase E